MANRIYIISEEQLRAANALCFQNGTALLNREIPIFTEIGATTFLNLAKEFIKQNGRQAFLKIADDAL